jgi:5-formyltetrahydrofolate cyclo-ligase
LERYTPSAIKAVTAHEAFKKAQIILFYVADGVFEIPITDNLLARHADKNFFFPITYAERLEFCAVKSLETLTKGAHGIPEPPHSDQKWSPSTAPTLIIVPAIALDLKGNRIGRGKGYYDKFLKSIADNPHVTTVAVVPSFAIFDAVPTEAHDVPIDDVLAIDL